MESLDPEVVTGCGTHLGHKVLEAGDDVGALKFLIVAEAAGDHNHSNESHCQVQLGEEGRESACEQTLEAPCTRPPICTLVPWGS